MRGSSIGYLIREGARNLYVNRLMSLASIGVLMACMLLIGASVLLSVNLNSAMERLEDQNEVVLFLEMGTEDYQIEEVQQMLDEIDNLQSVEFVSAQEAFEIQRERLGEDAVLLDGLEDDNPFPASFQVQVDDLSQFAATVQELEALPYIEKPTPPPTWRKPSPASSRRCAWAATPSRGFWRWWRWSSSPIPSASRCSAASGRSTS